MVADSLNSPAGAIHFGLLVESCDYHVTEISWLRLWFWNEKVRMRQKTKEMMMLIKLDNSVENTSPCTGNWWVGD